MLLHLLPPTYFYTKHLHKIAKKLLGLGTYLFIYIHTYLNSLSYLDITYLLSSLS